MREAGRVHARRAHAGSLSIMIQISRMSDDQAAAVAQLHIDGITGGFLSSLGVVLLADLYRAVNRSAVGFVFVATRDDGAVVGYVSGTTAVGRLYRWILVRRGWRYAWILARHLLSWRRIKGIVRSALYPARIDAEYPAAELLSIVVGDDFRGTPTAAELLRALLVEFRNRSTNKIKLIVGEDMKRANAFYKKHGFQIAGQIENHGRKSNVLVVDVGASEVGADA
ncbi:MAG: GNAT family N-acetyltransferase [Phycisphaerae bacterium]